MQLNEWVVMTLIGLIRFALASAAIVVLSIVTGRVLRVDTWRVGVALGIVALFLWIAITWYRAKNFLPACETGKCHSKDYAALGTSDQLGIGENGLVFRCRCGKRYLHSGIRFYAIDEGNGIRNYKVKAGNHCPWVDDRQ